MDAWFAKFVPALSLSALIDDVIANEEGKPERFRSQKFEFASKFGTSFLPASESSQHSLDLTREQQCQQLATREFTRSRNTNRRHMIVEFNKSQSQLSTCAFRPRFTIAIGLRFAFAFAVN